MRKWIALSAIGWIVAPYAFGYGGTEFGGGGNVVVLPDDTVVLADPYMERVDVGDVRKFSELNPQLQEEMDRVGDFLVRLGASMVEPPAVPGQNDDQKALIKESAYLTRSGAAKFIAESVASPSVEYRFVSGALPSSCEVAGDIDSAPMGSEVKPIGCTEGPITWIVRDLFGKMSIREQTETLLHERLHSLATVTLHEQIADLTAGIGEMLSLYNQQIAGARPVLTDAEVKLIARAMTRIDQLHLNAESPEDHAEFLQNWMISPRGGGLYHRGARVSPDAYLGVGSLLGEGGILAPGAEMINSSCYHAACDLRDHAILLESTIAPSRNKPFFAVLGMHSAIRYSTLISYSDPAQLANERVELLEESRLDHASVTGISQLKVGVSAAIADSSLTLFYMNSAPSLFEVGDRASLGRLQTFLMLRNPADVGLSLSVPADTALDFEGKEICPKEDLLLLEGPLVLASPNSLKGICRGSL